MWVAFALQKLLISFQQKISAYLRITRFNESLTNDIVSFEQLGPEQKTKSEHSRLSFIESIHEE